MGFFVHIDELQIVNKICPNCKFFVNSPANTQGRRGATCPYFYYITKASCRQEVLQYFFILFLGLLFKRVVPKEFHHLVELFHTFAVKTLPVDFATDFSVRIEKNCIGGLCQDLEVSFDKCSMLHFFYKVRLVGCPFLMW